MCKTIPTFYLYGLDAIPAHVIVEGDRVRVAERGTGRTLVEVKREPDSSTPAGWPSWLPVLVRIESAPTDLKKDAGSFVLTLALGLVAVHSSEMSKTDTPVGCHRGPLLTRARGQ
jgi:hypothetical protein